MTRISRKKKGGGGGKRTRKETESLFSDLEILKATYRENPQTTHYGYKPNVNVISLDILKVNPWMTGARGWNQNMRIILIASSHKVQDQEALPVFGRTRNRLLGQSIDRRTKNSNISQPRREGGGGGGVRGPNPHPLRQEVSARCANSVAREITAGAYY